MFLFKSKTIIFSYLLVALSMAELKYDLVSTLIPEKFRGLGLLAIAVSVALLRVVTTTPLKDK
jgi:hypothetical protein